MPRLFTAIEIPDHQRAELQRLRQPMPGAKWVEPADLHLTLRFAGDIDNRVADELAGFLDGIDTHGFELRLSGVGQFGGNDPRVIWAGVEPSEELETLARANDRAARQAGLPPDKRGFKPHVTLARLRYGDPDRVAHYLQRFAAYRSEPFTVERFVLMSAKPGGGGGPYVVEADYPLSSWGEGWEG